MYLVHVQSVLTHVQVYLDQTTSQNVHVHVLGMDYKRQKVNWGMSLLQNLHVHILRLHNKSTYKRELVYLGMSLLQNLHVHILRLR
jgi:hypothetical protein